MPAPKAPRKDWYSVSVDTLRSWGLLVLVLVAVGVGLLGYRQVERRNQEKEAAAIIAEAEELLGKLKAEKRLVSFAAEYAAARQSYDDAQSLLAARDFPAALENGLRSRNVLLSILDALEPRGSSGQAQFVVTQGEVEYRRGNGGDWLEARSRVQLQPGDSVRTSDKGSAEIMFLDGTLYAVRPNTQFIVSAGSAKPGGAADQAIEMEYGWVNLSTSQRDSNVKTPGAVARVRKESEAFVAVDKATSQGRFGTYRGTMQLSSKGGLTREVGALQQVVQTGELLSEPKAMAAKPELREPADNLALDLERNRRLVLAWNPVAGSSRYALQVSRNPLFADNVIAVDNRAKTRATLGVRGEGTFLWRVAAHGADGLLGPWSATRRFRVGSSKSPQGETGDTTPPALDLQEVKTYGSIFFVAGRSEPGARIEINGEQVTTDAEGAFNKPVQLTKEGRNIIEIRARDSWGNETVRRHPVFVENP